MFLLDETTNGMPEDLVGNGEWPFEKADPVESKPSTKCADLPLSKNGDFTDTEGIDDNIIICMSIRTEKYCNV